MASMNMSFGGRCPRCDITFGTRIGGPSGICSRCGGPLVRARGAIQPEALLNYQCPNCNSWFGHYQSVTPITGCPHCGHPIR